MTITDKGTHSTNKTVFKASSSENVETKESNEEAIILSEISSVNDSISEDEVAKVGDIVQEDSSKQQVLEGVLSENVETKETNEEATILSEISQDSKINSEDILNTSMFRHMFAVLKTGNEDILDPDMFRQIFVEPKTEKKEESSKPKFYNVIYNNIKKIINSFKDFFSSLFKKKVNDNKLEKNKVLDHSMDDNTEISREPSLSIDQDIDISDYGTPKKNEDILNTSMFRHMFSETKTGNEDILNPSMFRKMFAELKTENEDILNTSMFRHMFVKPKTENEDILNPTILRKMFAEPEFSIEISSVEAVSDLQDQKGGSVAAI